MDVWSGKQSILPPRLADMKGLEIEMCFNYPGEDGSQILDWYRGTIESMVNKKKRSFKIKWNEDTLAETDARVSTHMLTEFHWNPKKIRKNAWREYIDK